MPGGRSVLRSQSINLDELVSWWLRAISALCREKKKSWCLVSAQGPPPLADQPGSISVRNKHLFHLYLKYLNGPCRGKKRKHISVNIWLHRGESLDTAVSRFPQSKMKIHQGITAHTQTPRHSYTKSSKLKGLSRLAHFPLWIKEGSLLWKDNCHALSLSLNRCHFFSRVSSSSGSMSRGPHLGHFGNVILLLRYCAPSLPKVQLMPLTFNNLQSSVKSSD